MAYNSVTYKLTYDFAIAFKYSIFTIVIKISFIHKKYIRSYLWKKS